MSANGWDVVWPVVYEFPVVFSDSGGTVEKQWGVYDSDIVRSVVRV